MILNLKYISLVIYNLFFLSLNYKLFFQSVAEYKKKEKSSNHNNIYYFLREVINNIPYYTDQKIKINHNLNNDDQLNSFPIMTKNEIRKNYERLKSKKMEWKKIQKTSGSTGVPLQFLRSKKSFTNSQISFYLFFWQFGINRFDKNIYIGGVRVKGTKFSELKNKLINRTSFNQIKFYAADIIKPDDYYQIIRCIESFKPKYISGFSNALSRIAEFILSNNIKINHNLDLVHPTAEMLSDNQRTRIKKAFNCNKVAMVYGSSESHIASECVEGSMHVNEENCFLKTRKDGSVLLTVKGSTNFPFINYELGDQVDIDYHKKCKCGSSKSIISKINGRDQDKVKFSNGLILTHPDINMFIEQIDKSNHIYEYQFIYYQNIDLLEVLISADGEFNKEKFVRDFKSRFSINNISISDNNFEYNENGKKPLFIIKSQKLQIRKHFEKYEPYLEISESQKFQNIEDTLKLDWNESTEDFPKDLKKIFIDELNKTRLNFYPDLTSISLRKLIASINNVSIDNVSIYNGSDAAIDTLSRLFIEARDPVLIINPTYGNYAAISQKYGAKVIHYNLSEPFELDYNSLVEVILKERPKMIFIANPNNPTGVIIENQMIYKLIKQFQNLIFIIDEAYIEFGGKTIIENENIYENLFVIRTFSKAYGLAGARLGYSISSKENNNLIKFSKDNKEVSIFAQLVGKIALENIDYMHNYVSEVNESKREMIKYFNEKGISFYGSGGNFILIKIENTQEVLSHLRDSNVFIRDRSYLPGLKNFVRVTVGSKEKMKKFIHIFNAYYSKLE